MIENCILIQMELKWRLEMLKFIPLSVHRFYKASDLKSTSFIRNVWIKILPNFKISSSMQEQSSGKMLFFSSNRNADRISLCWERDQIFWTDIIFLLFYDLNKRKCVHQIMMHRSGSSLFTLNDDHTSDHIIIVFLTMIIIIFFITMLMMMMMMIIIIIII